MFLYCSRALVCKGRTANGDCPFTFEGAAGSAGILWGSRSGVVYEVGWVHVMRVGEWCVCRTTQSVIHFEVWL